MINQLRHLVSMQALSRNMCTCIGVGLLLILSGCGVREATTTRPSDMVSGEGDRPGQAPTIVQTTAIVPSPSPTPDIYLLYGDAGYIQGLREELTRTDLPKEARAAQQARLDQAKFEASVRATAQVGPTPVRRGRPPETAGDITPPRGILTGYNDIFKRNIDIRNVWQDEVDGIWWQIYAGAIAAEPDKGVVVVVKMEADGTPIQRYETPEQVGAVRIIAEQSEQLTLEAEDGTLFVFDIPSREFVEP
ncbi:MAG: hypothetical protein AAGF95_08860 [Chloroflexota bacterium]